MEGTLDRIVYSFSQEGNTLGTTDEVEELTITVETPLGDIRKDGGFLVIQSSTGWSIDEPHELLDILNIAKQGVSII
jgi:hypothetical protein